MKHRRPDAPDDEPIRIVPYDQAWPTVFERERAILGSALGAAATGGIHHVGSTAVPGLPAKPIIDILVGVEDLQSAKEHIKPLAALDYVYAPYRIDEIVWFCKPDPSARTHHLHLKRELAVRREAYTEAKADFVGQVVRRQVNSPD